MNKHKKSLENYLMQNPVLINKSFQKRKKKSRNKCYSHLRKYLKKKKKKALKERAVTTELIEE